VIAPVHRLRKQEIVFLANKKCKHRHSYLEHYSCYLEECNPEKQRIGFFDIEASSLEAGFGIMLSWAIKVGGSKTIHWDVITRDDIDNGDIGSEDHRIVQSATKKLLEFDKIVTHYGNDYRYDVPFTRTRAVSLGIPFPTHGTIKQQDTFTILKKKFKLPRNRLETACRVILGSSQKTHLDPIIWRRASRGDEAALKYIVRHNKIDVIELEKLYNKIIPYTAPSNVSL